MENEWAAIHPKTDVYTTLLHSGYHLRLKLKWTYFGSQNFLYRLCWASAFAAGLGDFPEGSPNKNKKAVDKLRNANGENMDTSQVGVDSVQECNQNNERKVVKKSRLANCDKDSTRAGKGRKNTKKAQRGGNGPSDVNQKGAFHTEDSKKKSKVRKEANNSEKKTRRKLSYARSHAAEGESNGDSSASPQLPSLKKSRSGRKLLRPLEFWRNQTAVYDMERELTCIKVLSSSANRSRATKK